VPQKPDTNAITAGRDDSRSLSPAIWPNSVWESDSLADATKRATGLRSETFYSRFSNPTVVQFENAVAELEGAELCVATGSGMSAMFASVACMVKAGDRVVATAAMFSSCHVVLTEFLPAWGVEVELVKGTDEKVWAEALNKPTKVVFIESPSNPLMEIVDIRMISDLAHKVGATVIVDNIMASPMMQRPLELGADVVMYSATKHIDGQGRVLGGAVLGSFVYMNEYFKPFFRHTGPSLSPFNAWVLLKSLETMDMRVERMATSAQKIAEFLATRPEIEVVSFPGLPSHPGHELAKKQMTGFGTTIGITFKGTKKDAYKFMDALRIIDISNNLGDSKSLITHPASTTHRRLSPQDQIAMGITATTLRLSVGLEHCEDLIKDITQALS
jgi:O-succinylhomoserine sulfhydrylase